MGSGTINDISLSRSMLMLIILVGGYGAYKLIQFIYLLIVGTTAEVALSGDISVPTEITDTINDTVTSVATGFAVFNTAELIVLGLIGLVVIIQIFWPLIAKFMPSNKKGGMN